MFKVRDYLNKNYLSNLCLQRINEMFMVYILDMLLL